MPPKVPLPHPQQRRRHCRRGVRSPHAQASSVTRITHHHTLTSLPPFHRRASSPYCFALYIRPKSIKSEHAPPPSMAQLDASALQLNPAMFLLSSAHEQQQQQQLAAASGNAFILGGAQQDGHAANMFLLGDYQLQQQQQEEQHQQQQQLLLQQHSNMFMLSAAHDSHPPPHSGGFT